MKGRLFTRIGSVSLVSALWVCQSIDSKQLSWPFLGGDGVLRHLLKGNFPMSHPKGSLRSVAVLLTVLGSAKLLDSVTAES